VGAGAATGSTDVGTATGGATDRDTSNRQQQVGQLMQEQVQQLMQRQVQELMQEQVQEQVEQAGN